MQNNIKYQIYIQECRKVRQMSQTQGWNILEGSIKNKILERINSTSILTLWCSLTNYFIALGMLKVFKIAEKMITDADKFDEEGK